MLQVFYGMSSDTAMKAHRDVSLSRVKSKSLRMSKDQFPSLQMVQHLDVAID